MHGYNPIDYNVSRKLEASSLNSCGGKIGSRSTCTSNLGCKQRPRTTKLPNNVCKNLANFSKLKWFKTVICMTVILKGTNGNKCAENKVKH